MPTIGEKGPPLGVKFDGDPQKLGFFLAQVLTYMQDIWPKLPNPGVTGMSHHPGLKGGSCLMDGDAAQC